MIFFQKLEVESEKIKYKEGYYFKEKNCLKCTEALSKAKIYN